MKPFLQVRQQVAQYLGILKYWATCCRTCKNGFITGSPFSSIAAKFPACTSNREAQTGQQVKTFLWNCDLYKLSAASVLQTHSNQLSGYTNATTKSIAARHINTQGVHKRCRFTSKSSCILLIRREWVQFVSQSVKTNNNDTMILWYYIKLHKKTLTSIRLIRSGGGVWSGRRLIAFCIIQLDESPGLYLLKKRERHGQNENKNKMK